MGQPTPRTTPASPRLYSYSLTTYLVDSSTSTPTPHATSQTRRAPTLHEEEEKLHCECEKQRSLTGGVPGPPPGGVMCYGRLRCGFVAVASRSGRFLLVPC